MKGFPSPAMMFGRVQLRAHCSERPACYRITFGRVAKVVERSCEFGSHVERGCLLDDPAAHIDQLLNVTHRPQRVSHIDGELYLVACHVEFVHEGRGRSEGCECAVVVVPCARNPASDPEQPCFASPPSE